MTKSYESTLDIEPLNGSNFASYWLIWNEDEIVLDGHFTYAALKAIVVEWERYRELLSRAKAP